MYERQVTHTYMKRRKFKIQLTSRPDDPDYKTGYVDNTPCVVCRLPDTNWYARSLYYPQIAGGYGTTIEEACNDLITRVIQYERLNNK